MADTIGSLVYSIQTNADLKGITATKAEMRSAQGIMREVQTESEKLTQKMTRADELFRKGALTVDQHSRAMDKYTRELREANAEAARFKGLDISKLGSLSGVGGLLGQLGIGVSIAGTIGMVKDSIAAAEEAFEAEKRLEGVLQATGNTTGFTSQQIQDYATKLQNLTGISDEAFTNAAAELATFGNIGGKVFKDAIGLAADLSRVFGTDLASETENLGRALSNPLEALDKLRLGTEKLTEEEKNLILTMAEAGDIAGAQAAIIELGLSKVGGAAEAMRSPITGLKEDLGNLSEEFGKLFTGTEAGKSFWAMMSEGARATADALRDLREGRGLDGLEPWRDPNRERSGPLEQFFFGSGLDIARDAMGSQKGNAILNTPETNPAQLGPGAQVDETLAESSEERRLKQRLDAERKALAAGDMSDVGRKVTEDAIADLEKQLGKFAGSKRSPDPGAPTVAERKAPEPPREPPQPTAADEPPQRDTAAEQEAARERRRQSDDPAIRAAQQRADQQKAALAAAKERLELPEPSELDNRRDELLEKNRALRSRLGITSTPESQERAEQDVADIRKQRDPLAAMREKNRQAAERAGIDLGDPERKARAEADLEKIRNARDEATSPEKQQLADALAQLDANRAKLDREPPPSREPIEEPDAPMTPEDARAAAQKNLEEIEAAKERIAEPVVIPVEVAEPSGIEEADKAMERLREKTLKGQGKTEIEAELDKLAKAGATPEQRREAEKLMRDEAAHKQFASDADAMKRRGEEEARAAEREFERDVREGERMANDAIRKQKDLRGFADRLAEKDNPELKRDRDLAKLAEAKEAGVITPDEEFELGEKVRAEADAEIEALAKRDLDKRNKERADRFNSGGNIQKRGSAEAFATIFNAAQGGTKNPNAKVEDNTKKTADATKAAADRLQELKDIMAKNLSAGF